MAVTTAKRPAERPLLTYEDYLLLPDDGKRYEIIGGELYMTPAPSLRHQNILSELGETLRKFVVEQKLGNVFYAPCDVTLSQHEIVQPDIVFVSKQNRGIVGENAISGAPDLVVEITSPTTQERDLGLKKKLYDRHGIKEYWIVLSEDERVEVFVRTEQGYQLAGSYGKRDTLTSPLLPGLSISLSVVFRKLEDYF